MHHSTFAGEESLDVAGAVGGKLVGGGVGFAAGAVTGYDKTRIHYGANKGNTFVGELGAAFVGVERELELVAKVSTNDLDVAHELGFLGEGNDNIKVIDVAPVVHITEVEGDEAVELVEENIGEELAGKIANDDAVTGLAVEETFVGWERGPIFAGAADDDVAHRVVVDDLVPEEFGGLVELVAVTRTTGDLVFKEVIRREGVRIDTTFELAVETPADTFVELVVAEADKITLDIERNREGRFLIVFSDFSDMVSEAFLTVEDTLFLTTRIGINAKTTVPPFGTDIKEEMVDDAVTERGSDDFAGDRVVHDKSDAAIRLVTAT